MGFKLNVSSEEKCLQRRLETVQGRRVTKHGNRFHAAGPATTNARPPSGRTLSSSAELQGRCEHIKYFSCKQYVSLDWSIKFSD